MVSVPTVLEKQDLVFTSFDQHQKDSEFIFPGSVDAFNVVVTIAKWLKG